MDAPTRDVLSLWKDQEPLTDEDFDLLLANVRAGAREKEAFSIRLDGELSDNGDKLAQDPVMALKIAQGLFALGRYSQTIDWLDKAGSGKTQSFLKGKALLKLRQYPQAIQAFEDAESKGADSFDITMAVIDALIRSGDLDAADEKLKRVSRVGEIRAEYHFQMGRLHEARSEHEQAIASYEKAIELDDQHTQALFYAAYTCDLYGNEKKALEYYRRCIQSGPVHVSALLNLAVLYEDMEEYASAALCVQRVLKAYPNHERARMFLKDIEASKDMYYDEDHEKRVDRRNQVLEIPISDFELSVRSRNCLKKMNIKTLGDLLRVTESELLAYKNFGETSLQEIKSILSQKNLRLGQMLEDRGESVPAGTSDEEEQEEENELYGEPITELELSVRARKALQRLNINTLGDLCKCTEAELLGCKNFGMTSLSEIKLRLKERGLNLRQLEE